MEYSNAEYALVIPFCDKDYHELLFTLELWTKNNYLPKIQNDEQLLNMKSNNIDLILYYATSNNKNNDDKTESIKKKLMDKAKIHNSSFSNIFFEIIYLDKKDDYHPKAPGIMFFHFMFSQNYESFFYCESDCIPIKNNWLKYLENELEDSKINDIWIKGSIYKGERKLFSDLARKNHINGNAIFRIKNDLEKNIFKKMSNCILKKRGAYDVEMMIYFYRIKNTEDGKLFFKHCKYTDFMLNFGKQKIPNKIIKNENNVLKDTYFIHGKQFFNFTKNSVNSI